MKALYALIFVLIAGTAYAQSNLTEKAELENPIIKKILTGEVRFNCGLFCIIRLTNNQDKIKKLYDNKQWDLLAIKTYEVSIEEKGNYFFLASAVEGLGYSHIAQIYYKLALDTKATVGWFGMDINGKANAKTNSYIPYLKNDVSQVNNKDQFNSRPKAPSFFIEAFASEVNTKGVTTISIKVNSETSSLTIDGEELGGKKDGSYITERFILAGQETKFEITAKDHIGNKATKTITVIRQESVTQNEAIGKTERQIAIDTESLAKEMRRLEEEKSQREQAKLNQSFSLQVNNSQPNADGDVSINIETNADTASLKINGEEQGGHLHGCLLQWASKGWRNAGGKCQTDCAEISAHNLSK